MKKVLGLVIGLLLVTLAILWLSTTQKSENDKLKVSVSTFALYDLLQHIGGDKVDVHMVIPFGVEVHSFEPTPRNIIEIQKSKLFFYSGASLEPWIKKLPQSANMFDMSQYVHLIAISENEEDEHELEHHHHGHYDPHYWLDISNMKALSVKVLELLKQKDPEHSAYYTAQMKGYVKSLDDIERAYSKRLKVCQVHEVILHHNILGYVAKTYGFEVATLTGLSPDALADAKTMAKLSKEIREKDINVLFFEAFSSDRLMKNLAKENGVTLEYLEPLANITADQAQKKMSYSDGMLSNLEKLSNAMRCQ